MGHVPNMVIIDGKISRVWLRKLGETRMARMERLALSAAREGARYFATRHNRAWHIHTVSKEMIRTGLTEDQAAMLLLHMEAH